MRKWGEALNEMLTEEQLYAAADEKGKPIKILDADWKENYGLALVLNQDNEQIVRLNGRDLDISFVSNSITHIRWIDAETILFAEEELVIIDARGKLLQSFNAGVAIEGIVVDKAGIWVSYFDEGFGTGIADEGLRLFDLTGKTLFRYNSDLLDRPNIFDCYALCKGKGGNVWIFPYTDFPFIEVNPADRMARVYKVPKALHGASAICVRGKYAYFFSPYDFPGQLFQLEMGSQEYQSVGRMEGRLRGLDPMESHHFLSVSEKEVKLCTILNNDEFEYQ